MMHLLHKLFEVVWREELVPPKWREGLTVKREIKRILVIIRA